MNSKSDLPKKSNVDREALKRWKGLSTKAKLNWLEGALRFGKLRKF